MSRMKKCETCRFGRMYELDKPCIVYREDCPLYEKEGEDMTSKEAKSCIKTIEMLRRLAYNIHGVMDVIDADNCEKIIKALEQEQDGDLISRQAVQDKLVELCIGIAPDETVTDIDELHCREAQMDILDEIMEWMKKQQAPKGKCILSQKYKDWQFIQEPKADVLDKIRAEIEVNKKGFPPSSDYYKAITRAVNIIDKYKAESDHTCHTCKHYTSGEYDGSCDSYICEHYSGWESEDKE